MPSIVVKFRSISAERLSERLPPQISFQTQLALPSEEPRFQENTIVLPYTFTITAVPPIVSLLLRGTVIIQGTGEELGRIRGEVEKKKIPAPVAQAALSYSLAEAVVLFRDLGVPPPIALPPLQGGKPQGGKKGYQPVSTI